MAGNEHLMVWKEQRDPNISESLDLMNISVMKYRKQFSFLQPKMWKHGTVLAILRIISVPDKFPDPFQLYKGADFNSFFVI